MTLTLDTNSEPANRDAESVAAGAPTHSEKLDKYQIGEARVDFTALTIVTTAGHFSIEPKVLDVLRALTDAPGDVVTRETLIDKVWAAPYGGDERLSRAISLLRKALGDSRGRHHHIETVPKRGYRLIAPTVALDDGFDRQTNLPSDVRLSLSLIHI